MENKTNIAEILRYAPKGIKLWDIMHGCQLQFDHIDETDSIVCFGPTNEQIKFCPNGAYFVAGECMIFPDEEERSWDHWQDYLFKQSIGSVIVDQWGEKHIYGKDFCYGSNPGKDYYVISHKGMNYANAKYAPPETTYLFLKDLDYYGYMFDKTDGVVKEKQNIKKGNWYICDKKLKIESVPDKDTITFKEGRVYKCTMDGCLISEEGLSYMLNFSNFIDHFRFEPWSIDDIKIGDILVTNDNVIFLNAGYGDSDKETLNCICYVDKHGVFKFEEHYGSWIYIDTVSPVDKDQRSLFFRKMNENGYKWENNKLIKIDKKVKKQCTPEVGMLLKYNPDRYSDPFNVYDKEEYLSRVYIITSVKNGKITIAPIDTRSVITLDFKGVENACPINLDYNELLEYYHIYEGDATYDVKFLETWDRVLVRNTNEEEWKIARFSHLKIENFENRFVCDNGIYRICVPWNVLTKHLVGTSKKPIPFYNRRFDCPAYNIVE